MDELLLVIYTGSRVYHMQVSVTQKKQARALVRQGKATVNAYPEVAVWAWNEREFLQAAKVDSKGRRVVYNVGFPSVYQTSEHTRFDLCERPRAIQTAKPQQLGIGHILKHACCLS